MCSSLFLFANYPDRHRPRTVLNVFLAVFHLCLHASSSGRAKAAESSHLTGGFCIVAFKFRELLEFKVFSFVFRKTS